jgi:hypothetical protein
MANLVSLDDYKIYKKKTKTEDDEVINQLITSVSTAVKMYCGHSFIDYYAVDKVEIFNIDINQHAILLNEWPVNTVSQVEYRDSYLDSYTILDASEYYVDKNIDTLFKHSGYWPEGYASVKVTYRAGYTATPGDIKIACLDLISHYLKEEYKERKTIGQVSIDNSQSNMGSNMSKWPSHVSRVLDMYKNV